MSKINIGRVILGGVVAGIIIDVAEFVLNGIYLADQWRAATAAADQPDLGMNQVMLFNLFGLAQGLIAVWLYAAIRPRFGAGAKTAVYAALAMWLTTYVLTDAVPTIAGFLPLSMTAILVGAGLVEIVIATLAGAYFYKEA